MILALCVANWRIQLRQLGDTEVQYLDAISAQLIGFEPDVVRLQISVNDPLLMRFVNRRANLLQNVDYPIERQALLFCKDIAKSATIEVLHHQVGDRVIACLRETKIGDVDYVG